MAVENYFTNNASNVGEKTTPGSNAHEVVRSIAHVAVAAADDNNSTYLLFKDVPSSFTPVELKIWTDAITSGTDFNIGVANSETGVVIDDNLFADAINLSSASKAIDGLENVAIEDIGNKSIATLLGLTPTTAKSRYDIILTGIAVGTAAGDITAILDGFAA